MNNNIRLFLVATYLLFIGHSYAADQYYQKSKITRKIFDDATEAANSVTPTMTDPDTLLTSVTGDFGQGITVYKMKMVKYKYSDFSPSEIQELPSKLASMMIQRNCSSPDIRWKFDQGFSNQYVLRSSDEKLLGSVLIGKTQCDTRR